MSEIDTSREDAQFNLGELLAVIHRDGGYRSAVVFSWAEGKRIPLYADLPEIL